MDFAIIKGPQDALNNPLVRGVEHIFGINFTDVDDLVKGYPLKDIRDISFDEYFARNLFKKIEDDLGFDPDGATRRAAVDHINLTKVNSAKFGAILDRKPENLMLVLSEARNILHRMFKDFNIFKVVPRYTTGATEFLQRGEDLFTRIKDGGGYETLKNAFSPLEFGWLMSTIPHIEKGIHCLSRHYTLFECVPKTAKVSRPIGYHEPLVLAVQAGIGDYIEKRLRHFTGIDITTAEEKHKLYAWYHSVTGEYCTLDQSNASQNILRAHCNFLLPAGLFDVISKVCPDTIYIDGTPHHHQMMAAQGNGLIFPLQTAIFYALIRACARVKGVDTEVLQYGDDSIFATELFGTVFAVLNSIGMEVNNEKSFFSGTIRESCGGDYLEGINVRPFYAKRLPKNPTDWYHICNGIYRVGFSNYDNNWRSLAIKRLWLWCLGHIPAGKRYFGPTIYGDDVLHHWDINKSTFNHKGDRIRALGTVYTSDGGNFGRLSQGIPGSVVLKALTSPSFKGAGFRSYSDSEIRKLLEQKKNVKPGDGKYPSILGIRSTGVAARWLNYPLSVVKNHDDVDSIFESLHLDSLDLMQRHQDKLDTHRWFLLRSLKELLKTKKRYVSEVEDIQL